MLSPGSTRPSLWFVCYQNTHGHILIVQLQGFVTQAAIVQIDLLTSIGNPSPITTCILFICSKLSNSLLPSVCIPAYQDSCRLYITSFPDFPHMHGELENEASLQTHGSCYIFLIKVITIQF